MKQKDLRSQKLHQKEDKVICLNDPCDKIKAYVLQAQLPKSSRVLAAMEILGSESHSQSLDKTNYK